LLKYEPIFVSAVAFLMQSEKTEMKLRVIEDYDVAMSRKTQKPLLITRVLNKSAQVDV